MDRKTVHKKIETIGNGIMLLLGLLFLGNVLEFWDFDPFGGWWLLLLYIPAVCGFLTRGFTAGNIMLTLTVAVLTVGMFVDTDGRLWSAALILYLAYLGFRPLFKKHGASQKEVTARHEL